MSCLIKWKTRVERKPRILNHLYLSCLSIAPSCGVSKNIMNLELASFSLSLCSLSTNFFCIPFNFPFLSVMHSSMMRTYYSIVPFQQFKSRSRSRWRSFILSWNPWKSPVCCNWIVMIWWKLGGWSASKLQLWAYSLSLSVRLMGWLMDMIRSKWSIQKLAIPNVTREGTMVRNEETTL